MLDAVTTGLNSSCSHWSSREDCLAWRFCPTEERQEEVYSAAVLKEKAGKQGTALLLLKLSSKSQVQLMQQFIPEIAGIS